jgi:hypothetical protein
MTNFIFILNLEPINCSYSGFKYFLYTLSNFYIYVLKEGWSEITGLPLSDLKELKQLFFFFSVYTLLMSPSCVAKIMGMSHLRLA